MELVGERGWEATTTRQIAERARVNQALIHYHFGSKDGLLYAAFEVALRDMLAEPVEALVTAPSFSEGIVALVRTLGAFDQDAPEMRFGIEALSRAARDETVRRVMAEILSELRGALAARIVAGQESLELDPGIDPEGTAAALGALLDGLGLHLLIDPTIDVERTAAAVTQLLTPHQS